MERNWLDGLGGAVNYSLTYAEKVLYEKIIHHVVNMMEEEGVKNGER